MTTPFLIDAHSHINFSAYKDDAAEVIARAEAENIWMLAVGSQIDTSRRAVEYAEQYPHIWALVGLHPIHLIDSHVDEHEVGGEGERILFRTRKEKFDPTAYRKLAQHPKTVGIGECGLDYYRGGGEIRKLQEETFRQHIALAQELDLPLIVHVRDGVTPSPPSPRLRGTGHFPPSMGGEAWGWGSTHEETIRILTDTRNGWRLESPLGMIHCYSGTWTQAERYLALGFNISFTGVITFKPTKKQLPIAEELWRTVRGVPIGRFHVETDCPYLTPEPHRGERNEPRYVFHVAEKVAELKGITIEEAAAASTENTLRLFRRIQA